MKVLSWNVQWGRGVDGTCSLKRTVKEAKSLVDFDVLCLQEVASHYPDLPGSDGGDQFAELVDLLPGFVIVAGFAMESFDSFGRQGRFGNIIATRLPINMTLRHALPWEADMTQNMPRMLIEAIIQSAWGPVRVMTTHLEWSSELTRAAQVSEILAIHRRGVERHRRPRIAGVGPGADVPTTASAILVGDFNMTPDHPQFRQLQMATSGDVPPLVDAWAAHTNGRTHPTSFFLFDRAEPARCVDFALLTPDLVSRISRVHYDQTSMASDHQPLIVELA